MKDNDKARDDDFVTQSDFASYLKYSPLSTYNCERVFRFVQRKLDLIESQRLALEEKDREIGQLRHAKGLLPVCQVDQDLFAADVTCRQQATMIQALESRIKLLESLLDSQGIIINEQSR